ncbi:HNH/ENDO VII family nuclease [Candidatus Spyradosoma sp. SGI.093]|uniref:HNH/ENDO VII family nuclease n=1 Tax=Candidatus Spyradosoma sp. SGI.093 TaxID=3420583 RepID=UPI003D058AF5
MLEALTAKVASEIELPAVEVAKQQLAEKLAGTQTAEMARISQQEGIRSSLREADSSGALESEKRAATELGEKLENHADGKEETWSDRLESLTNDVKTTLSEKLESVQSSLEGLYKDFGDFVFREKLGFETGWSDEIIGNIKNSAQAEIFQNANLTEKTVNGRTCLVKEIDMDYVNPKTGKTNFELCKSGRSPIDAHTGEKYELHHIGQKYESPFAELRADSEHGDGKHSILHEDIPSWRHQADPSGRYSSLSARYNHDRVEHWKARAQEYLDLQNKGI